MITHSGVGRVGRVLRSVAQERNVSVEFRISADCGPNSSTKATENSHIMTTSVTGMDTLQLTLRTKRSHATHTFHGGGERSLTRSMSPRGRGRARHALRARPHSQLVIGPDCYSQDGQSVRLPHVRSVASDNPQPTLHTPISIEKAFHVLHGKFPWSTHQEVEHQWRHNQRVISNSAARNVVERQVLRSKWNSGFLEMEMAMAINAEESCVVRRLAQISE